MIDKHYLICVVIQISVNYFIVPIKTVCVESIGQSCSVYCVLTMSLGMLVSCPICSPMKSRRKGLRTASVLSRIAYVSSTFHNVDLSTIRPSPVFKISWHHPNRRPKPISFRQFSPNLNSSVSKGEGFSSCELSTDDRRKIIRSIRFSSASVIERSSTMISDSAPHIKI